MSAPARIPVGRASPRAAERKLTPITAAAGPFMIADLSRRWRCSERHVNELIEEGKLQAIDIAGRNLSGRHFWRIPAEAVIAFEQAASNLAEPAPKPTTPRRHAP
jgi:hypothetical protein